SMPTPSLAIVIVNFNTRELLAGCLDSVFASRCPFPFRVILVDNHSTDGSAAFVREHYPQVELYRSDRNGGFGYPNNIARRARAGRRAAPGPQPAREIPTTGDAGFRFAADYALFLNPDTVLPPDAFAVMVEFLERTPRAGIVGPRMQKPDGNLDLACR